MRRFAGLAVVVFTALVGAGAPAAAGPATALNREVTGTFTGTAAFEFGSHGCDFVFQTFDVTFQPAPTGSGTLHIEGCVNVAPVVGSFAFESGSFTLTSRTGATLIGTVSGGVFPLDLTLTSTEGTRSFRQATGTIAVDGSWSVDAASGSLTGSLQR
jgi:hypothetical protein